MISDLATMWWSKESCTTRTLTRSGTHTQSSPTGQSKSTSLTSLNLSSAKHLSKSKVTSSFKLRFWILKAMRVARAHALTPSSKGDLARHWSPSPRTTLLAAKRICRRFRRKVKCVHRLIWSLEKTATLSAFRRNKECRWKPWRICTEWSCHLKSPWSSAATCKASKWKTN